MNFPDRSQNAGHLGYEIIENGKVIGFTDTATYFDGTKYPSGYVPQYQIRAYDQKLNCTAASEVWQFEKNAAAVRCTWRRAARRSQHRCSGKIRHIRRGPAMWLPAL